MSVSAGIEVKSKLNHVLWYKAMEFSWDMAADISVMGLRSQNLERPQLVAWQLWPETSLSQIWMTMHELELLEGKLARQRLCTFMLPMVAICTFLANCQLYLFVGSLSISFLSWMKLQLFIYMRSFDSEVIVRLPDLTGSEVRYPISNHRFVEGSYRAFACQYYDSADQIGVKTST